MEYKHEQKQFLYKYKTHLDFVLLTHNKSVSTYLIKDTKDLPWHVDSHMNKLPIPATYLDTIRAKHTVKDQNNWNYIEARMNPYWTWDFLYSGDALAKNMAKPQWKDTCGRWFFDNWCQNNAILTTSKEKVIVSLKKYVAATKIQRCFRRCITDPSHPFCTSRLLREFTEMRDTITQ